MSESEATPDTVISPNVRRLITNGTIPLVEADTEEEFKTYFKYNLDKFPHVRFRAWLEGQTPGIQRAAKMCQPTKLYRLNGDDRLCAITGYKSDGAGDCRIVVMAFGEETPQFVDVSQLRDVSAELFAG